MIVTAGLNGARPNCRYNTMGGPTKTELEQHRVGRTAEGQAEVWVGVGDRPPPSQGRCRPTGDTAAPALPRVLSSPHKPGAGVTQDGLRWLGGQGQGSQGSRQKERRGLRSGILAEMKQ